MVVRYEPGGAEYDDGWRIGRYYGDAMGPGGLLLKVGRYPARHRRPARFTAQAEGAHLPHLVRLDFTRESEVYVLAGLHLTERDTARPIGFGQQHLRGIPVRELADEARRLVTHPDERSDPSEVFQWARDLRHTPVEPRQGVRLDDDHYRRVADVYRNAELSGDPPVKAVAIALAGSARKLRTANRWVRTARDRGFLPEPGDER